MQTFDAKAEAFLKEPHFAKLATLMRDGSPQLTPIWYMYEDGKLIVNTTRDRVKFRNIRRDARVALLVDNGYTYVTVFGRGRVAEERDPKADIERLAIRYRGEESGRKAARDRYWKMDRVSIEIVPERIVADL
ncbi:MAG: PPOX class F420-dependent oxidoreductase [Thaumarchaeota archaeon]|nr:PPOX class F420-dependent oxidoreductase [Nitrososphaerota archaeon]